MTMPYGAIGLRHTCESCGAIHYSKHSIVAGCIVTSGEHILLCRRAIEPYLGSWTIPAGYLETGETLQEAAMRETREEAGVSPTDLKLLALYSLPMFSELYTLFSARLPGTPIAPGPESLEVRLVRPQDIDWAAVAFPMVREALRHWLTSHGPAVDVADFLWGPDGGVRVRRQRTPDTAH